MSVQLDTYLQLRADGVPVDQAAERSAIGLKEAELWEADIEAGEVELPLARAGTRIREAQPSKEEEMVNGTVSGDELRLLIERIERLHEQRKDIADDIKDVFAEAKARGFDTHAMKCVLKIRKMDDATLQEAQAVVDLYVSALGMKPIENSLAVAA